MAIGEIFFEYGVRAARLPFFPGDFCKKHLRFATYCDARQVKAFKTAHYIRGLGINVGFPYFGKNQLKRTFLCLDNAVSRHCVKCFAIKTLVDR